MLADRADGKIGGVSLRSDTYLEPLAPFILLANRRRFPFFPNLFFRLFSFASSSRRSFSAERLVPRGASWEFEDEPREKEASSRDRFFSGLLGNQSI